MKITRYVKRVGPMVLLYSSKYSVFPERLEPSEFDFEHDFEGLKDGEMYEAELSVRLKREEG